MPIDPNSLTCHGAASRPEDDVSAAGGAIDATHRPVLTQPSADSVIAAVSDGADARTLTVTGRLPDGTIATEDLVLNGAVEVVGATVFAYLLKLELSAVDGARTVTVRQGAGGAQVATITPGEQARSILFIGSKSEAAPATRYEKMFWRNGDGALALLNAEVTLTADPAAKIRIGVGAVGGVTQVANRKTAPGGVVFVDDGVAQSVPGGNLAAGQAVEVWVEQALAADDAALRSTFTTQLAGESI